MQDNDPKHTSVYAQQFLRDSHVNWWRTPDLNPIENLWHELKEFVRKEIKSTKKKKKKKKKSELVGGILKFWDTVTVEKCNRYMYINHLKKVIPEVIELNNNATGY